MSRNLLQGAWRCVAGAGGLLRGEAGSTVGWGQASHTEHLCWKGPPSGFLFPAGAPPGPPGPPLCWLALVGVLSPSL